jgi:hypothetical protein
VHIKKCEDLHQHESNSTCHPNILFSFFYIPILMGVCCNYLKVLKLDKVVTVTTKLCTIEIQNKKDPGI